jgi:hypothetical protein
VNGDERDLDQQQVPEADVHPAFLPMWQQRLVKTAAKERASCVDSRPDFSAFSLLQYFRAGVLFPDSLATVLQLKQFRRHHAAWLPEPCLGDVIADRYAGETARGSSLSSSRRRQLPLRPKHRTETGENTGRRTAYGCWRCPRGTQLSRSYLTTHANLGGTLHLNTRSKSKPPTSNRWPCTPATRNPKGFMFFS